MLGVAAVGSTAVSAAVLSVPGTDFLSFSFHVAELHGLIMPFTGSIVRLYQFVKIRVCCLTYTLRMLLWQR